MSYSASSWFICQRQAKKTFCVGQAVNKVKALSTQKLAKLYIKCEHNTKKDRVI